jgi:AAA domain/N-terminal domain of anti-restriction factor ArdC
MSSKSVEELHNVGITSQTIASLLSSPPPEPSDHEFWIVDESSLLDTRTVNELLKLGREQGVQRVKGTVRKGEHGSIVVFAKRASKEVETDAGEIEERNYSVLRYYSVFNLEQTDGCKLIAALERLFEDI